MRSITWKQSLIIVTLLALVVTLSTACCKRQVVRVQTLNTACLTEAPPLPLPEAGDPKPDPDGGTYGPIFDECEGWEACLTFENAGKLVKYLRETQRWMRQAHLSCSENPQPPQGENE